MSGVSHESHERKGRWQSLFRDAAEPLFLLSRNRRLLYANLAWEKLTGLALAEVRGQTCRRRATGGERAEQVLAALAPPPEALAGQCCTLRRRGIAPTGGVVWWDLAFFPWSDAKGPQAILGKISSLPTDVPPHAALPEKLMQLRQRVNLEYRLENLPSASAPMQRVVEQIRLAATTSLPVWLQGPPGSGKEWVARTIHHMSPRREMHFAAVAGDQAPASVVAELLHEAKRRWHVGTIYLRRPERLPREAQELVLQALRGDGDQPRIIAGSAAEPQAEVNEGRLLHELYCGLSALMISMPSLTHRCEDLPRLLERLLPRALQAAGKSGLSLGADTVALLRQHAWPGNITELYEVLAAACTRAGGERLEPADLPFYVQQAPLPAEQPIPLDEVLEKVERRLIELALKLGQGNRTRAAELLAIWRPRLLRRMEQLGLGEG
jgi:PAS domain S-box-containing protein